MAHIKNEAAYEAAMARIEELLKVVSDDMPLTDPRMAELDMLSELVEEYEDLNYPFPPPEMMLTEAIKECLNLKKVDTFGNNTKSKNETKDTDTTSVQ